MGNSEVNDTYLFGGGNNSRIVFITRGNFDSTRIRVFSTREGITAENNYEATITAAIVRDAIFGCICRNNGKLTGSGCQILDLKGGAFGGLTSSGFTVLRLGKVFNASPTITLSPISGGGAYAYFATRGGIIDAFPTSSSGTTLGNFPTKALKGGAMFDGTIMFSSIGGGYITDG
jgi:hypothetical protein